MPATRTLQLTRRFAFSAAHRLHSPALDARGNACAYGLCENIHGHNYRLEVTVSGEADANTGFFCNVLDLSKLVHELIVDPCEHRLLNDLPLFAGVIVTMEGIAGTIFTVLEPALAAKGMRLVEVLVGETDEHWVRVRAE
jgi:6-pyruvoyltetrahydropterin/6-carboxytetrahydropterin synthase